MIGTEDVNRLTGTDVYDSDGDKIGTAGQVYLDDQTGQPEWITVRTGLFGTKESFVPLNQASFAGDRLTVPFDKASVKDAPRIDPDGDLSTAQEDELYAHYGLASTDGQLSGTTTSSYDTTSVGRDRDFDGVHDDV
jgi:sporulation protein YlmC with PRC-barrel domain